MLTPVNIRFFAKIAPVFTIATGIPNVDSNAMLSNFLIKSSIAFAAFSAFCLRAVGRLACIFLTSASTPARTNASTCAGVYSVGLPPSFSLSTSAAILSTACCNWRCFNFFSACCNCFTVALYFSSSSRSFFSCSKLTNPPCLSANFSRITSKL